MFLQQFLVLRINTGAKIALKCHFFAPRPLEVKKWEWLTERAWSKTFRFIDTKAKLDLIYCHWDSPKCTKFIRRQIISICINLPQTIAESGRTFYYTRMKLYLLKPKKKNPELYVK